MIKRAIVPARAYDELGTEGVQVALRHLYLIHCMSCDEPLAGKPTLLFSEIAVDGDARHVDVSVHHADCQAAEWVALGDSPPNRPVLPTFRYMDVAITDPPPEMDYAIVVVNPHMEHIGLTQRAGEVTVTGLELFGFLPYHEPRLLASQKDNGLTVSVVPDAGDEYRVGLLTSSQGSPMWTMMIETDHFERVLRHKGLVLLATHSFDPWELIPIEPLTVGDLRDKLDESDVHHAWATLRVT